MTLSSIVLHYKVISGRSATELLADEEFWNRIPYKKRQKFFDNFAQALDGIAEDAPPIFSMHDGAAWQYLFGSRKTDITSLTSAI